MLNGTFTLIGKSQLILHPKLVNSLNLLSDFEQNFNREFVGIIQKISLISQPVYVIQTKDNLFSIVAGWQGLKFAPLHDNELVPVIVLNEIPSKGILNTFLDDLIATSLMATCRKQSLAILHDAIGMRLQNTPEYFKQVDKTTSSKKMTHLLTGETIQSVKTQVKEYSFFSESRER
jgi:hypothetical protein